VIPNKLLVELVLEQLDALQADLVGMNAVALVLWDQVGSPAKWRPISEGRLSEFLIHELRIRLSGRQIVLNREVEISPRPRGVGERVDILVQAFRSSREGEPADIVSVVIEVKGSWNDEVATALEGQLVEDYLVTMGSSYGIYLVGWFPREQWDSSDSRWAHAVRQSPSDLAAALGSQATQIASSQQVDVRVCVLDFHRPERRSRADGD
jgi:hypothetical protein